MTGYEVFGRSECGPVRAANEDHILLGRFIKNRGGLGMQLARDDDFLERYGMLFAVADGVGGSRGGHTASCMALETFQAQYYGATRDTRSLEAVGDALRDAGTRANTTLLQLAANRPDLAGLGCTLAGVCLTPDGYWVFHAGDSRVYRYRNGALKQLTEDDSLTGIAVAAGYMTHRDAEQSEARNAITNCVGSGSFRLTLRREPALQPGDWTIICSDGLHGAVKYDECEAIISASPSAKQAGMKLVDEAIERGGHDNVSVITVLVQ